MFTQIINHFKNIDFSDLIYYEEKIGGLSIDDDKIVLTYLDRRSPLLLQKEEKILFQGDAVLPTGTIEKGILKKPEQLLLALKKIQENKKLPSKSVIVSLPSIVAQPFIFEFFPNLKTEEINEAINLIVDSSLPLEKDKIYVDWEEIGVEKSRENKFILAMGVKKEIDPYLEVISKSGLAPVATETHAWSLPRAVDFKGEPVLAINFESSQIIFTVYQNDTLVFQFNLPKVEADGSENVIVRATPEAISVNNEIALSSARNDAGADKREPVKKGRKKKQAKEKIVKQVKEKTVGNELAAEIKITKRLIYFLASDNAYGFKVKNIILFGNPEVKQKFQSYFADELNISGMETEKNFVSSLGAAKRGLLNRKDDTICSLMPIGTESAYERQRFISFLDFFQKLVIAFGGFFVILFFGAFILVNVIYQNASKNMTKYQAEIPPGIAAIKGAAASFNQRMSQLTQIEEKSPKWENLFLELDKVINPGLIIGDLSISAGQPVGISGFAKSRENLLQLKSVLEQSPTFMPITLPLSLLIGKENIYFSFKLELKDADIIYVP